MPNTREKLIELQKAAIREFMSSTTDVPLTDFIADYLIANCVTVQQWIPVTERLPEVVDSYLVVVKCKYDWEKEYSIDTDVATYNPYEKAYIDDCWNTYNDWNEGQQYLHVTHWMPLPNKPKED